MPSYRIEFVGDGNPNHEPMTIHCFDDAQALRWASGFLGSHLAAAVSDGTRQVGWVTASGDQAEELICYRGLASAW